MKAPTQETLLTNRWFSRSTWRFIKKNLLRTVDLVRDSGHRKCNSSGGHGVCRKIAAAPIVATPLWNLSIWRMGFGVATDGLFPEPARSSVFAATAVLSNGLPDWAWSAEYANGLFTLGGTDRVPPEQPQKSPVGLSRESMGARSRCHPVPAAIPTSATSETRWSRSDVGRDAVRARTLREDAACAGAVRAETLSMCQ